MEENIVLIRVKNAETARELEEAYPPIHSGGVLPENYLYSPRSTLERLRKDGTDFIPLTREQETGLIQSLSQPPTLGVF